MDLLPAALDPVILGRWQFGITTVYHFILVPLTLGLSICVAIMQSMWHASGKETWLKATRFFGKLLLINFALGVATGIVQEFQFGMNWSEYSRFVGDIFGAPLAIEALLAFFMESTFLGLWIFGWGRIPKGVHLATAWLFSIGASLSALWILTANSWMQHPTGALFNTSTGRAELNGTAGFLDLLGNPVTWLTFTHVITSAWLLTGTFIAGIAVWWMTRSARTGTDAGIKESREVWRPITVFGLWVMVIGGIGTIITGHIQGQEVVKIQPAKMAAAEAICVDTEGAAFTVAAVGDCPIDGQGEGPHRFIEIPGVASFLASNSFDAEAEGVAGVQQRMVDYLNQNDAFVSQYGDASQYTYIPHQMMTFWSFRLMIGLGALGGLFGVIALIALWTRKNTPTSKVLGWIGLIAIPMPFIGSSFGWIFTEMGRQPWVVHPNLQAAASGNEVSDVFMMTELGVSSSLTGLDVLITMILFTVLYAVLGVIWFLLMKRYVQEGVYSGEALHGSDAATDHEGDDAQSLSFGY